MQEIDQEVVDAAVEAALSKNDLKQSHGMLRDASKVMQATAGLLAKRHPDLSAAVQAIVINDLENVMWNIETKARESAEGE